MLKLPILFKDFAFIFVCGISVCNCFIKFYVHSIEHLQVWLPLGQAFLGLFNFSLCYWLVAQRITRIISNGSIIWRAHDPDIFSLLFVLGLNGNDVGTFHFNSRFCFVFCFKGVACWMHSWAGTGSFSSCRDQKWIWWICYECESLA